jgi:CheY-like chemotaxis protein
MKKIINPCLRCLIVDDEPNIRKMLAHDLKELGVEGFIYEVPNGKDALKLIKEKFTTQFRIGFIITDIHMPKMDVMKFLKKARELSYTKHVPIIILTSDSKKATVIEAITKGASNFLLKPWTNKDLLNKLNTSWSKHLKTQE